MKDRPECITLLITVILGKHDMDVDEVILQADDHSVEHRSVVFDVLGNHYNVEIQNGREGSSHRRIRENSAHLDVRMLSKGMRASEIMDSYVIVICDDDYFDKKRTIVEVDRYFDDGSPYNDGNHIIYFNAAYKNSETGERKMSSVWKEVEDEGIAKGIIKGKSERSAEVARNLLAQKVLSNEQIAQATDLSLDEVSRIKSQMKMC